MSFNIYKQLNADAQEGSAANEAAETAATPNVPETATATPAVETEVATPAVEAETTAPVVDIEIKAPVAETVVTAHDDFDWSVDKRNVTSYTADEKAKYDTVYDNTFKQINDGEMIQATVLPSSFAK